MVKLCNLYGKTLKCRNDPNVSAFKDVNLILDYSQFNQIKKINVNTQKCKLEPGATFESLNNALGVYGFYVPYVVPLLNENAAEISLD
jgi:FAD/FMN-containing dehydrogenase